MNNYQKFIHTSRYARWLDTQKRRETWEETVDRFMLNVVYPKLELIYISPSLQQLYDDLREAILKMDIMPSMRALMTAGVAMNRDNTSAYNCAYLPVDGLRSFDEAMFILLCGTGVGYSVEQEEVRNLPQVPRDFFQPDDKFLVVEDSKEGWAQALQEYILSLFTGIILIPDVTKVRPAGSRLKTFGGRASGPAPLLDLFVFIRNTLLVARGRQLTPLECSDIMCKIGETVVVGGVRRSAMICLSDLSDEGLRYAKSGQWWEQSGYRALANLSVAYSHKPSMGAFFREWLSLYESKSGERGIINRESFIKKAKESGRRDPNYKFGVNP